VKDDKYEKPKNIPKKMHLRIINNKSNDDCVKEVREKFSEEHKILSYKEEREQEEFKFDEIEYSQDGNNEDLVVKNLMDVVEKNCSEEEKCKIEKRVRNVVKSVDYQYETDKKIIKIKSLLFNNFNVFGEDNFLDYLSMKGIINVCGKNGIGK